MSRYGASVGGRWTRLTAARILLVAVAVSVMAIDAEAATRSVTLKGEHPIFSARNLLWANISLVFIALLQAIRGIQQRRKKFKVVRHAADQAPTTPQPAPSPDQPAPGPAQQAPRATASPQIVRCGSCAQPLKLATAPRPIRFKCPKCQTVGVVS